jgi:manganese efflux pump family protein
VSWPYLLGIALGLAMDAFAVAIATGVTVAPVTGRHVFRIAFHFGLFQFLMPILGWLAGAKLATQVSHYDHWIACAILSFVGSKMLIEACSANPPARLADPTRGWLLISLSVATSLDALAVGLSMALLGVPIVVPALIIGGVAGLLSMIGITFAGRLGERWRRPAEIGGALVLIAIGARIVWIHVMTGT